MAVSEGNVSVTQAPTMSPSEAAVVVVVQTLAPTAPDHKSNHEFGAANTLLLVCVLLVCMMAGYFLQEKKVRYLPESGSSMLVGAIAGAVVRGVFADDDELEFLQFSPLIFFFVLLPPIIFEAGYTLKKKRFFANLTAISLYAVVGTFVSTIVVGFLTYLLALIGVIGVDTSSPLQSLLFGSLISSVDPVATLAILGSAEANCDPLLYSLVFGESVLNDAVAIVLFHVMNSYAAEESKTFSGMGDVVHILVRFVWMTLASVLIGVSCGLVCSFICKCSNIHRYHAYEIQLLFMFSFGSFALAELAEMSGVVSLFFCAVTLAHYNYYNLSVQTKISSKYVFESLAKTSETVVFMYMGLSIFISKSAWDPAFIIFGTAFCVLGRACNIFPMTWLANKFRPPHDKISRKMRVFMFFSGLRGAVSYALAQQLSLDTGSKRSVEVIQTTTLGIVIFTTFFLGGTTSPVLEKLNLKHRDEDGSGGGGQLREDFSNYHEMPSDHEIPEMEHAPSRAVRVRLRAQAFWRRVDEDIMKPWFGGKGYQKARISPELYNAIQEGDMDSLASSFAALSQAQEEQERERHLQNSSNQPNGNGMRPGTGRAGLLDQDDHNDNPFVQVGDMHDELSLELPTHRTDV